MTDKVSALRDLSFGQRVAEEEGDALRDYFVETDQWRRIFDGEVDIVYGAKGAGKSAIFALLQARSAELAVRKIRVIAADSTRGNTIFKDLVQDPPTTEREFVSLWKLYFLLLIGEYLQTNKIDNESATDVIRHLQEAKLLKPNTSLRGHFNSAVGAVRKWFRAPKSVEGGVKLDQHSGLPTGLTGKITFGADSEEKQEGWVSLSDLLESADRALADYDQTIWLLIDRLDAAFEDNTDLEENALRALFKTYLDLRSLERIHLKIFLRTDIWQQITRKGFREASHIIRTATIEWDEPSLLNLAIRRATQKPEICAYYGQTREAVLASKTSQSEFFYRMFPDQIDVGPNKSKSFVWILNRIRDGLGYAPRELIHMLNRAREIAIKHLEMGESAPDGEALFTRTAVRDALREVSKTKIEQTLFTEYPHLKPRIESLRGQKTRQTAATLAAHWDVSDKEAIEIADKLVDVGFFERQGTREDPQFWVPFLFRPGLDMVQGTAELEED